AAAILQKIGNGSVYFKSLSDMFTKAENGQVDDARRKAQALANVHDCNALKNFVRTLTQGTTGTERVVGSAAAVKCTEKVAAATRGQEGTTRRPPPAGSGEGGSSGSAQATPPKQQSICETMNVDDIVTQAKNQFTAGFAKTALTTMSK